MKNLVLWLSLYLFGLVFMVMVLRIVTGKSTPASRNDPVYISTINRILTNTIEQSIIFAGLYGTLIFNDSNSIIKIGGVKVLALASIFIVSRVTYAIGYILGAITGLPTLRGFGFGAGFIINLMMVSYHLGFSLFNYFNENI